MNTVFLCKLLKKIHSQDDLSFPATLTANLCSTLDPAHFELQTVTLQTVTLQTITLKTVTLQTVTLQTVTLQTVTLHSSLVKTMF